MKKLLVVVDFQNDFVDGALGFDGAKNLENIIENKIIEFKSNSYDIVFTLDTHKNNYLQSEEGKKLPIPHVIKGTKGHEIYGKIKKYATDYPCLEKYTFGSDKLMEFIKSKPFYDEIELCGLVSSICVISNAIIAKAASPNSHIAIDAKATDSYDKTMQEKCFDILEHLHVEIRNR
ncbi:cysteine hydrolase [Campylobacter sp. RM12327]|uniref:cysteine hydrolase family protein n=1 Tax=Campylobacter sputorum TaxID=206 RepID=UPI000B78DA03|nr:MULTISPECIES: isochorismatase family cysteine hydrolase [Campylobacter]ASM39517.1 pyrazinamidase / nicotinamidase [Campylobacter sputorum]MBF6670121.1 cysteine hydrolase [Campylobacter sp. RM12327]MBF6675247.1 cysteine hydrolase [Campylobacter sp. RM13538]MBF6676867.1 cysteine hydrolase [Campylobacter sp. RM12321]MBF6678511.1 cysteine hydrolase [Campylobacter sp. RM11259]